MAFVINHEPKKGWTPEGAIDKYTPLAFSILRQGEVSPDDCQDLIQDAVLKMYSRAQREDLVFDAMYQFKSYFLLTIRSVWMDKERAKIRGGIELNEQALSRREDTDDFSMNSVVDEDWDFVSAMEEELEEDFKKRRFQAAKTHISCAQYLVMTLRLNGYSFKEISQMAGFGLNTALGVDRYAKIKVKDKIQQKRLRTKRFREGREGTATRNKLFMKLPPKQYFVVAMKEFGYEFNEIAELDGGNTNTTFYRWQLAQKNLEVIAENEEDYLDAIDYLESLNTNVGGAKWHKRKRELVEYEMGEKQIWYLQYITEHGPIGPKAIGLKYAEMTGGSADRSGSCSTLRSLVKRGLLTSKDGVYSLK